MPKINIYAGKLQIPLKDENAKPKSKGFQLQNKEELCKILQGCLLLYDGEQKYKVEELLGRGYASVSEVIIKKLKNETNSENNSTR
jgi:hypothetical protein